MNPILQNNHLASFGLLQLEVLHSRNFLSYRARFEKYLQESKSICNSVDLRSLITLLFLYHPQLQARSVQNKSLYQLVRMELKGMMRNYALQATEIDLDEFISEPGLTHCAPGLVGALEIAKTIIPA